MSSTNNSRVWRQVVVSMAIVVMGVTATWCFVVHDAATSPDAGIDTRTIDPGPSGADDLMTSQRRPVLEFGRVDSEPRLPRAEPSLEDENSRPHPIDAQRVAINRQNNFNAAMMGAVNMGDHLGLRALLEEYSVDYPEDEYRLQAGYGLIADCLEGLTPDRREAARKYWQENRGSLVRRFIRRHCLERDVIAQRARGPQ